MKTLPIPALVALAAAAIAAPFNLAAAGTLFLTAWMGLIIHADYVLRRRRAALPRRPRVVLQARFRRFAVATESNRLAA